MERKFSVIIYILLSLLFIYVPTYSVSIQLSNKQMHDIGRRIWVNECAGKVEGLTHWGDGEDFPSLGIGHFIWCPPSSCGTFDETFPKLRGFLAKHGKKLPDFFQGAAPWNSQKEFFAAYNSEQMKLLRNFLADTVDLQVRFIINRFKKSLLSILKHANATKRSRIKKQFERIASTPSGVYALVDYINFKGEGIKGTENYGGNKWGLLQVIENMNGADHGKSAVEEFAECAKKVLRCRIDHAPPSRNEERWWPGWQRRIETYKS